MKKTLRDEIAIEAMRSIIDNILKERFKKDEDLYEKINTHN